MLGALVSGSDGLGPVGMVSTSVEWKPGSRLAVYEAVCVSGQVSVWLVCDRAYLALGVLSVRDGGGVSGSGYVFLAPLPCVHSLFVVIIFLFCLRELSGGWGRLPAFFHTEGCQRLGKDERFRVP